MMLNCLCGETACGMLMFPGQEDVPLIKKRGLPICARYPHCAAKAKPEKLVNDYLSKDKS